MKFITTEAKELAKQIHKEEHLIVDGKIEKKHKLADWYYCMASGIFKNLQKSINEVKEEVHNSETEFYDLAIELNESMKEISKQQKYLWQTLEELFPKKEAQISSKSDKSKQEIKKC